MEVLDSGSSDVDQVVSDVRQEQKKKVISLPTGEAQ